MVGVVILPEEMIEKLKKNILPQHKTCLLSAIIVGIITHMYKITNWLPNWDSLVFRYDEQNMLSMGRWFLGVASAPSSFYDLPWLAGLLAIIIHALSAVCICKMFDIKKNTTAILVGATVASFPTVTSVMMYNYVADSYALSFLFACIAALLLTKEKPNYIVAVALIALSVGIYQAYITVTIMLLLCHLILETLKRDTKVKAILLKTVKFLSAGVVGMALYYIVLTIILKITGTTLLEYQGFDSAMSLSNLDILGSIYTIKESFVNYFFNFSNGINLFNILNVLVLVSAIVMYLVDIIRNKPNFAKILLLCVFIAFLPIGASVLAFINSGVDYHNLMKMGFVVFYLFFILQYEKTDCDCKKINAIKSWTVLAITTVLVLNQVVIANISYHKLNIAYEKSYGILIRIADRIEQTEGADDCDRILVLGALEGSEAYSAEISLDMTGTTDGLILRADDEMVGQSVLCSALNDYCAKNYGFVSGEEKTTLLEKFDAENLGCWPEKDSVIVVDNVIVVKLSD